VRRNITRSGDPVALRSGARRTVTFPAPVRARKSEGKTMAENTNFYTAEESLFGLPPVEQARPTT
jgi:hypothetical protein